MTPDTRDAIEDRILVLAPTGRDGPLIAHVLVRARLAAEVCSDAVDLCRRADAGAGALVVAEEALSASSLACLDEALVRQPVWSDLPLVVLTGGGKTTRYSMKVAESLGARGTVTLLERPLRMLTLVSASRTALRARRRQYEVRNLLEQTQQAVRQRDRFLAMLGHELRNPLAAIRAAIEVVNQSGFEDRQLLSEQAEIITRQSSNVTRLVDDLLDVARVTSGKIALDRRPVDLREIAERGLKTLRLAVGVGRHEIAFETSATPLVVDGDEVRLEQVVMNLLANAVRYTPEGGKIWMTVGVDGCEAVLRVRDTGRGIPATVLPHIFEPFVQSEQSLARSAGGLGIGLTVVRTLVRMHGGAIAAASGGPGLGSEFTVRLPLVLESRSASLARGRQTPLANGASRRVLLIEDNTDTRTAMERLLRLWGHCVEVAADGTEGIRQALASRPEMMLVDIGLPDLDGYEVARRVRPVLGAAVQLVALTGYGQPEDRQRAADAGFDRHLVKPVSPDQLQKILHDGTA